MTAFDDMALERMSTPQQVAGVLREKILSGYLAPGEPLRESAIATSLHISRNTVREAVRILERGGLVKYEMHRGAVVIEPSLTEVTELYQARLSLEVAAALTAHTEDGIRTINDAFLELQSAAGRGNSQEIVLKDLGFHAAIVALLNSTRLNTFYDQLATEMRFYLMVLSAADREYERPEQVIEEHSLIMEAFRRGEALEAAGEIRRHAERNCERLRMILRERIVN